MRALAIMLLLVSAAPAQAGRYTLGELTSKEYPNLVAEGQPTDTIAVPAVLAVYGWPKGSDRYRRVEKFTEAFFTKWDKFREPPRHPKWRDVELALNIENLLDRRNRSAQFATVTRLPGEAPTNAPPPTMSTSYGSLADSLAASLSAAPVSSLATISSTSMWPLLKMPIRSRSMR